jgi:hypothetical protein
MARSMTWRAGGRMALTIALGLGMTGAVIHAGKTKFWEKRKALAQDARTAQEREGFGRGSEKAMYAKYPTPELALCKPIVIAPGASAPVTLAGKFADKTAFLVANDQVEIEEGTVAAGKYTTKATVAADAAAGYAPIYAIAPVSGAYNSCPAVFVTQISSFELTGDNGWTVTLTPQAKAFEVTRENAKLAYTVAFSKAGEATPFKKLTGRLELRFDQETGREISVPLEALAGDGSSDGEYAALQKKMSDPGFAKLPPKEMQRILDRYTQLSEVKMKEMSAPDYAQKAAKEHDDFGCQSLSLTINGATAKGRLSCGRNVGKNGYVNLTGTSARVS